MQGMSARARKARYFMAEISLKVFTEKV